MAALISGVLLVLSFPKYGHPAVAFVAHARTAFASGLFAGATHASSFPGDAVEFIRRSELPAERLYNFYPWGGFLLFEQTLHTVDQAPDGLA